MRPQGWWHSLLDLVFPSTCGGCGRLDWRLCSDCRRQVKSVADPYCPQCGRSTVSDLVTGECCTICGSHPLGLDGLRAAVNFEGALRKAIHAFKYRGRRDLAAELAALMVESWNWRSYPIDVVVPVPLHPGRMALRGYNQATVLAEAFGCRVGIPIVPGKLVRDRDTVPQTRLAAVDRRTNVAGAFSVPPVERPFGKSVLLVDDVYTTGSTLRECGMALRTGGAKRGHDVGPRCVESTFRTDGRRANRAGMT